MAETATNPVTRNDETAESTDPTGVPSGLVNDEPETPVEGEPEADEAEATEEVATDAEAAPEAATDAGDPDKANPGKKVEQLVYDMRSLEKQVTSLVAALNSRVGQSTTPTQQAAAEEVTEQLSDIEKEVTAMADDDFLTAKSAKTILARVRAVEARLEQTNEVAETAAQTAGIHQFWQGFNATNPDLVGQGPTLEQRATEILSRDYADVTDPAERKGVSLVVWKQVVSEAKAEAKGKAAPAVPKPVAATAPVTPGVNVKQPKATGTTLPTRSASTPVPPRIRLQGASSRSVSGSGASQLRYSENGVPVGLVTPDE